MNPFVGEKFGDLLIFTTLLRPSRRCSSSTWEHASKWCVRKMSFLGPLPQYLPHIFRAHANASSIVAHTYIRHSCSRATIAERKPRNIFPERDSSGIRGWSFDAYVAVLRQLCTFVACASSLLLSISLVRITNTLLTYTLSFRLKWRIISFAKKRRSRYRS